MSELNNVSEHFSWDARNGQKATIETFWSMHTSRLWYTRIHDLVIIVGYQNDKSGLIKLMAIWLFIVLRLCLGRNQEWTLPMRCDWIHDNSSCGNSTECGWVQTRQVIRPQQIRLWLKKKSICVERAVSFSDIHESNFAHFKWILSHSQNDTILEFWDIRRSLHRLKSQFLCVPSLCICKIRYSIQQ